MGSSGQSLTKRKDLIRISSGVPHDKSLKGKPCVVDTLYSQNRKTNIDKSHTHIKNRFFFDKNK